eukprot:87017-Pelagomonas_calceolata.AAC.1
MSQCQSLRMMQKGRAMLSTNNATDLMWLYSNLRLLKRTQDLQQLGKFSLGWRRRRRRRRRWGRR